MWLLQSWRLVVMLVWIFCLGSAVSCAQSEDRPEFSPQALERVEILEAFDREPQKALAKYKAAWLAQKEDGRQAVQMTTIAGELAEHDPANSDEYLVFIKAMMGSQPFEVRSAAIGALGKTRGREAIDLLIESSRSDDSFIAQAAMGALNYRLAHAHYDPASTDDAAYIRQHLPQLCSHPYRIEIEQFCDGKS